MYKNFKEERGDILKENKNKPGVYCLVNVSNGHFYIGSSSNLSSRMRNYLNVAFLKNRKNVNMPIVNALLKYGSENFAMLIVEYTDLDVIIIRESHWITKLQPYYNVLKQGYSSLGYKHTEATKELLSDLAKNRTHSPETKTLIAKALTGENNPFFGKIHSNESKIKMIKANSAYPLYIYNNLKELIMVYPSVLTLAKRINSNSSSIVKSIDDLSLFRGGWYFSRIPFNLEDIPLFEYNSSEGESIITEMNNNAHIRKAIFLFDSDKKYIQKFDGLIIASKELGISIDTINKHAKSKMPYKNYIFSYEHIL